MPNLNLSINNQLKIVQGKILQLPLKKFLKTQLLADVNLAIDFFTQGKNQNVVNSLSVISEKIHTWQNGMKCGMVTFNPLLADLHILQQTLIALPLSSIIIEPPIPPVPSVPSVPPVPPVPPIIPGPPGPQGEQGPGVFEWGECIIWADSSAPGPGDGTPSNPYNSLQAAINAATNSPLAVAFGMRARCIVLIAANSAFDEDLIIPPARHVQLLGLGPWVLGDANLANFTSSVPRNVTIQTNSTAESVYLVQGPAFAARPVTVIGTFDNGTSVSTHTNYTDGAIVSGNVIFQNTDPDDPFTTIEFQLLNTSVVGSIIQDPVDPHMGILNTYLYNCLINIVIHNGLRIQRMVDSRIDGTVNVAGYSLITNTFINGNVTVVTAFTDLPPTGIFSSQFSTITWTGSLVLDTASNFYFVNSSSTLIGAKTILFSLD